MGKGFPLFATLTEASLPSAPVTWFDLDTLQGRPGKGTPPPVRLLQGEAGIGLLHLYKGPLRPRQADRGRSQAGEKLGWRNRLGRNADGLGDLPLGDTRALGHAAMINFIGGMPPLREVLALPSVHYHDYGKTPRPKRKLGHATIVRDDRETLLAEMKAVLELAEGAEAREAGRAG
jgi:hypothetical protein